MTNRIEPPIGGRNEAQDSSFPLWNREWRNDVWTGLGEEWDLLIIGGGITGVGLLNEAASRGWKAILVEENDFAWGASSRSSKLIHGGMRYLAQLKFGLTRSLLLERDLLLDEVPGLVNPLPFVLPTYSNRKVDKYLYRLAIDCYDILRAKGKSWKWHSPEEVRELLPGVETASLEGGFRYLDAVTEDARLVLRVLREGTAKGASALNYTKAESLVMKDGQVVGARVLDLVGDERSTIRARVVVNATGAGGDGLRTALKRQKRLRPLRGAHLVIPRARLPLDWAGAFRHPEDGRYVYLLPWEGATLVGTTDLDHKSPLDTDPRASEAEVAYLLTFVNHWIPGRNIIRKDITSTFAGIRPVVSGGSATTHTETRSSVVWEESGLVTIISGKMTGFRRIVRNALNTLTKRLHNPPTTRSIRPFFSPSPQPTADNLPEAHRIRLQGRYGPDSGPLIEAASSEETEPVLMTPILWAELRWGARAEGVVHLDDLLLRRTRLGLVLPEGAKETLPRVRSICQEELLWNDEKWEEEVRRYLEIIQKSHGVPNLAEPEAD